MSKGFSLIELMISIAIMAVITGMVAASIGGQRESQELKLAANNIASLVRKAQVWSITGHQTTSQVPIGGYGITVINCSTPPCTLVMFADLDGSLNYNSAGNPLGSPATNPAEEKAEELLLEPHVKVIAPAGGADFQFKPPTGTVCQYSAGASLCPPAGPVTIMLQSEDGLNVKYIDVATTSGQVTVR